MDNPTLTHEQRFVNLLNESSGSDYKLGSQFKLGAISPVTREDGRNTRIMIEYVDGSKPPIEVFYRRLPPSQILEHMVKSEVSALAWPREFPVQTRDIVDLLRIATGLRLSPTEYTTRPLTGMDDYVTIDFTSNSLVYLPGTVDIPMGIAYGLLTEDGKILLNEDGTAAVVDHAPY